MIRSVLRRGLHWLTFLCGEGSWSLRRYEEVILDAVLERVGDAVRETIRAQLAQAYFVERIPAGRINVFRFYHPRAAFKVQNPEFEDHLLKVRFVVDGSHQTAHVTFYRGYLFSIEFKKPGKFYFGKTILVDGVEEGTPGNSYVRALDRLEHGRNAADD